MHRPCHSVAIAASNAGRAVGYSGVNVRNPDGKLIGRVRLPEVVHVSTQGAAPG